MALRRLLIVAPVLIPLACLAPGCGPGEVQVKSVPASEIKAPPPPEARLKTETKPQKGGSGGMNYNPGGPPPKTGSKNAY